MNSPTAWMERCPYCSDWKLKVCAEDAVERNGSDGASATGCERPRQDHVKCQLESDGLVHRECHEAARPVELCETPSKY